jgi:anaerobic ribonucleoside-triphosphate reductase activating protein
MRCTGCISPQWLPFSGGRSLSTADLAQRIAAAPVEGLTISGGEPFAQAGAVASLIEHVRDHRDMSALSYTGYSLPWLQRHGGADQRRLLSVLDLLIDGPYIERQHADLSWRASSNQVIHRLSDRHSAEDWPDQSAGLQIEVAPDGTMQWLGVPPVAGFRSALERSLFLVTSEPREASTT